MSPRRTKAVVELSTDIIISFSSVSSHVEIVLMGENMQLLNANPKGGRPLDGVPFSLDIDDSCMAWKIGYVQCGCGLSHSVSVRNEDLQRFVSKCHVTLKNVAERKFSGIVGKWLRKAAEGIDRRPEAKQLMNGVWVTK